LKRLVVGGLERVYEVNRNFRNEGVSTQHNPEFTMLELYMAYADHRTLIDLLERLLRGLAVHVLGTTTVEYQGHSHDLSKAFRRLSVEEAVLLHNPDLDRRSSCATWIRCVPPVRALGIAVKPGFGAGKLLIEIFEKTAEHALVEPTFITGYPAEVSPLARKTDADPFLTDRFEFFINGRELANGFSELNDPEDQAARFQAQVRQQGRR
jgi:lysyl-tRNA synthetase class 2